MHTVVVLTALCYQAHLPDAFNSKWTRASTTLERLAGPAPLKATYGCDVTQVTLTYPIISNTQSYYLQIKAGGRIQDFPGKKPNVWDKYLVVTLPIDNAANLQPDSNLEVQAPDFKNVRSS